MRRYFSFFKRHRTVFLASLLVGALLTVIPGAWFILFPEERPAPLSSRPRVANTTLYASPPTWKMRRKIGRKRPQFEESLGTPLEERIKQVDNAILESLVLSGMKLGQMRVEKVSPSSMESGAQSHSYHFQRIVLQTDVPPHFFVHSLQSALARLDTQGGAAQMEQVNATAWRVNVMERPTHELLFVPFQEKEEEFSPPAEVGLLVIVMDDLGLDLNFARKLAALPITVSFSVLPRLPHTLDVARLALANKRELLLHQPMEPVDKSISPGPGALFVHMNSAKMRQVVQENLRRVKGARGLNNHMGSRFTQDKAGVEAVLDVAQQNNLFVIDSLTHPGSVFFKQARLRGVPVLSRDFFLDVVKQPEAIYFQLRKAEQLAVQQGKALAIGHPYPETLEALTRWSGERGNKVRLTTAEALLRSSSDSRPLAQKSISR